MALDFNMVLQGLIDYVSETFLEGEDVGPDGETPLLEYGLINSMSLVKLSAHVKAEYGVTLPREDLTPDNLETLTALAQLIVRHSQG